MFRMIQYMSLATIISTAGLAAGGEPQNLIVRQSPSREWLASQQAFVENRDVPGSNNMWKASLAALFAASAVDIHSSLGKRELNPLLRSAGGQFTGQGIAIKALVTGGAAAAQWFMLRKNPSASKYAAIANLGMSGMFAAAAANNYGNRKAAPATLK